MKRICYIILTISTLYLAVLYNSAAIVFLAGVELLLPLFLFLPLFVGNFLLRLRFAQQGQALEAGQEASLTLQLVKKGFLPLRQIRFRLRGINHTTGERYRKRVKLAVERGQNPLQELGLPALGYGVWHFSVKGLKVYDYICLWRLPHPCKQTDVRLVLPRRFPVVITGDTAKLLGDVEQQPAGNTSWEYDRSERGDLREYRPGDAMSEIHWKLSAKKDALLVWEQQRQRTGSWLLGISLDGFSQEKAELVYSLLWALYEEFGKGNAVFLAKGEVRMISFLGEQDLVQGMGLLMEEGVQRFSPEQEALLSEVSLWVREPLSLYRDGQCLLELPALLGEIVL